MRVYNNLPEKIVSKGKTFLLDAFNSALQNKPTELKYRTVYVLHRNLRGKTDLHGQPYKPHMFIFVEKIN